MVPWQKRQQQNQMHTKQKNRIRVLYFQVQALNRKLETQKEINAKLLTQVSNHNTVTN